MAGHSKWANIKHKKGAADKKKGKLFSKVTREILISVKTGGADATANPRLRAALIAARAVNMPNANIERAIKKASGEDDAANFEEIMYEGYGPGGVGVLVECMTDNRNRTASEIRMIFDRGNGNMAGNGAVSWMFQRKSYFMVTGDNATEENLFDVVIDAGAEDLDIDDGVAEVWGPVEAFEDISNALEKAGFTPEEASLAMKPENTVEVKDAGTARTLLKLVDRLEDNDDAQNVYVNFDIDDAILEEVQD